MPPQQQANTTNSGTRLSPDDLVLVRDPERYWLGQENDVFLARVRDTSAPGQAISVTASKTGKTFQVRADYVRLLAPSETMADIDNASLEDPSTMVSGAAAWIRQNWRAAPATHTPEGSHHL